MIDKSVINIFCAIMIAITFVFSFPNKERSSGIYSIVCVLFTVINIFKQIILI